MRTLADVSVHIIVLHLLMEMFQLSSRFSILGIDRYEVSEQGVITFYLDQVCKFPSKTYCF